MTPAVVIAPALPPGVKAVLIGGHYATKLPQDRLLIDRFLQRSLAFAVRLEGQLQANSLKFIRVLGEDSEATLADRCLQKWCEAAVHRAGRSSIGTPGRRAVKLVCMTQVAIPSPPPLPQRDVRPARRVGLTFAVLSVALPFLPFAYVVGWAIVARTEPPRSPLTLWVFVASGIACGVIALLGLPKWGVRTIWMLAVIGLAINLFLIGMSFTGPG